MSAAKVFFGALSPSVFLCMATGLANAQTKPLRFPDIHKDRIVFSYAGDGAVRQVTSEMFADGAPAWDPKGNYLFYLSERQFAPQISNTEWNYAADRQVGIYALALRNDVPHPFPPESDEESAAAEAEEKAEQKKETGDEAADEKKPIGIDFDGLGERAARVPVPEDNYTALAAMVPGSSKAAASKRSSR